MSTRICKNGHTYEKTSDCPVCPLCSSEEMNATFGTEFPKLGAPAFRALDSLKIRKLSDLSKYTEKELLALHGFGPKALRLLKEALQLKQLTFAKQH